MHIGNLAGVRRHLGSVEATVHGVDNAVAGLTQVLVDTGDTQLHVTEAGGDFVADAGDRGVQHLVTEAAVNLVALIHPRVHDHAVGSNVVAAPTAKAVAPTAVTGKQEKQNQEPQAITAEAETAVVHAIAATIHRGHRHGERRSVHSLVINSHCLRFLSWVYLQPSARLTGAFLLTPHGNTGIMAMSGAAASVVVFRAR